MFNSFSHYTIKSRAHPGAKKLKVNMTPSYET